MNGLARAVLLLVAGALLQFVVPRGKHPVPAGLTFLATARLQTDGPDEAGYCASSALPYALSRWTIGPLYRGDEPHEGRMDFHIACRSDKGVVRLTVTDWRGRRVTEASAPHARPFETSLVLADALSEDRELIRAVMEYLRYDASAAAEKAAEQWKAGEWRRAAGNFNLALEGGVNPVPMYYGLYESHAKLGQFTQAYWYLLCYLKVSGKTPQSLEARQLEALRGIGAAQMLKDALAQPSWRPEALYAYREGSVNRLEDLLRKAARETPWDSRVPRMMAELYRRNGRHEQAESWEDRTELAESVEASFDVQTALLSARLLP